MSKQRPQYCTNGHDTIVHGRRKNGRCNICTNEYRRKWSSTVRGRELLRLARQRYRLKRKYAFTPHKLETLVRSCEKAQQREFNMGTFWLETINDPLDLSRPISIGPSKSAGTPHNEYTIHYGYKHKLQQLAQIAKYSTKSKLK